VIVAVLLLLFFGQRLMEENTQNVLSLIRHMCRRETEIGRVFRTRQMCPQCKQNAHVNYTGQQEPRNKRTLTTKANRSLWLRVFVFLCELKMTHFESKRSKIETHTIKRRKIKKSASELTFKRETTGKQKP